MFFLRFFFIFLNSKKMAAPKKKYVFDQMWIFRFSGFFEIVGFLGCHSEKKSQNSENP